MKDLIQISFSVKVEVSPLAKGLTEPIEKVINKGIPILERIADTYAKSLEKELAQDKPADK